MFGQPFLAVYVVFQQLGNKEVILSQAQSTPCVAKPQQRRRLNASFLGMQHVLQFFQWPVEASVALGRTQGDANFAFKAVQALYLGEQ
ncbi:hypothetical protein D3C76_1422760 [compost metagenome]